ncbi:thioredoxin-like protein [Meredithblackwellia eburnea MCA 4105]
MPAMNYDEDTEFNAALRAHGIIPPKPEEPRTPSPEPTRSPSPSLSDIDDLDLTVDDALSREVLEKYRAERMREVRVKEDNRKFGRVFPISKVDYTREVTEASEKDLEGEDEKGKGTPVVCCLFKDYLPDCKLLLPLLDKMATLYPSTKFVKIVSDHCIENYPDRNCPTLLVYRGGKMMGQVVGMRAMNGDKATIPDVERILFAFRGVDFHLKVDPKLQQNNAQYSSKTSASVRKEGDEDVDEGDDSEDDQSFVGGGRRSGIRTGGPQVRDAEDDEFDL